MTKSSIFIILILFFLAGVLGYNYYFQPFNNLSTDVPVVTDLQTTTDTEQLVESEDEDLLIDSSVGQIVGQMLSLGVDLDEFDQDQQVEYQSWMLENKPGFVTIFGSEVDSIDVAKLQELYPQDSIFPIWTAVDHEGGTVQRLSGAGFTKLPSWQDLCGQESSQSASLIDKSAQELAQVNIDVVFAPVVDISNRSPVLKTRICSDDPQIIVANATQFIDTFSQAGILPVIKHFPGIGETSKDLHQAFDQVDVSPTQASIYRSILSLYPQIGVMVSHVGVTNQFADIPCSLSSDCVGELGSNYPDTLIFSDALDMKSAAHNPDGKDFPLVDVVMEAVEAGDQVLVFSDGVTLDQLNQIKTAMVNRYQTDSYFQGKVDRSVRNIIKYKMTNE